MRHTWHRLALPFAAGVSTSQSKNEAICNQLKRLRTTWPLSEGLGPIGSAVLRLVVSDEQEEPASLYWDLGLQALPTGGCIARLSPTEKIPSSETCIS